MGTRAVRFETRRPYQRSSVDTTEVKEIIKEEAEATDKAAEEGSKEPTQEAPAEAESSAKQQYDNTVTLRSMND